jgi:diguanylate cyclase (GGDEF)-like protein
VSTQLITLSYISSLIANVITLLGGISVFTWLKDEAKLPWIRRHRTLLLILSGCLFLAFLHLEAWVNTQIGTSHERLGLHWTYLNVEIVVLFNLLLLIRSKWQLLVGGSIVGLWLWSKWPGHDSLNGVALAGLLVLLVISQLCGDWAWRKRWHNTLLFTGFAGFALAVANQFYPTQDGLSWARQIGALIILEIAAFEYNRILHHHAVLTHIFAHEAKYDPLTGVRNFGAFSRDLERLFQQFQTDATQKYAIYTLDIDHFKRINDTYGHLAGNQVLQTVSQHLNQYISDLPYPARLYRTGGEEFTVILNAITASANEAELISRGMQKVVATLDFHFEQAQVNATISIGEDRVLAADISYLDLYKRADHFLYTSKENGRNAITLRGKTLPRESA